VVFSRLGAERDYVICQEKVELRFSTSAAREKVMQIRLSNSPECVLLGIRYRETAVRIRRWVYGFLLGQKADGKFTVRPKGRKGFYTQRTHISGCCQHVTTLPVT
jgi:hypothetical protein